MTTLADDGSMGDKEMPLEQAVRAAFSLLLFKGNGLLHHLEDVFGRELHLAGLQQQGASTADVGAKVGACTVGLQGIGCSRRGLRIEPVGVQDIEYLGGEANLLLAKSVK